MCNEMLTISMSSMMSSTLSLNLRMTQIGIRCSGTKKCSQRYHIDHFCPGFFVHASNLPKYISKYLPNCLPKCLSNYLPKYLSKYLPKYFSKLR